MTRLPPACCRMSAPNRPAKDRVIDQDGYVLEKVTNSSCDGGETKLRSCTASSLLHTRYMRRELAPHTVHCVIKGGLFSITISMAFHSQCRTAGRGSREGRYFNIFQVTFRILGHECGMVVLGQDFLTSFTLLSGPVTSPHKHPPFSLLLLVHSFHASSTVTAYLL